MVVILLVERDVDAHGQSEEDHSWFHRYYLSSVEGKYQRPRLVEMAQRSSRRRGRFHSYTRDLVSR